MWPWLTQLGWHLGGYYTPEWVDRVLLKRRVEAHHLSAASGRDPFDQAAYEMAAR